MSSPALKPHPSLAAERVLAIISPSNIKRLDEIKASAGVVFPRLDCIAPDNLEHLAQTVQRTQSTHRIVIAVGGDGTLHQVLQHIEPRAQVLGLFPGGTGNDSARLLGYRDGASFAEKAAHLASLSAQPYDLCKVNGIRFHNSAGFGVDAATCHVRESHKGPLHSNYILAFLFALAGMRRARVSIDLTQTDGSLRHLDEQRYYWVLAMNNRDIGGGTPMAPLAMNNDGLLDLVLVAVANKLQMLSLLPAALKAEHIKRAGVEYVQVREAQCRAEAEIGWLAVDGELYRCPRKDVRFSIEPGGLQLLR